MTKAEAGKVDYEIFKEFGDFNLDFLDKLKFLLDAVEGVLADENENYYFGFEIIKDLIADAEVKSDAIWEKAHKQGGADHEN